MKRKKKRAVVLLCLFLIATMIVGCSIPGVNLEKKDESLQKTDKSGSDNGDSVTIERQVLCDQDGVVITALEYVEPESEYSDEDAIMLSIENKTDKIIRVDTETLVVNNYMCERNHICEVASGETVNERLIITGSFVEHQPCEMVGQVDVVFKVSDAESYDDIFTTDLITIQTSEYKDMDNNSVVDGVEIYNENGVRIVEMYAEETYDGDTNVVLYIENNSKKGIGVEQQEVKVNGKGIEVLLGATVFSGKKDIQAIKFSGEDLQILGIEKVKNVELQFVIRKMKNGEISKVIGLSDVIQFDVGEIREKE